MSDGIREKRFLDFLRKTQTKWYRLRGDARIKLDKTTLATEIKNWKRKRARWTVCAYHQIFVILEINGQRCQRQNFFFWIDNFLGVSEKNIKSYNNKLRKIKKFLNLSWTWNNTFSLPYSLNLYYRTHRWKRYTVADTNTLMLQVMTMKTQPFQLLPSSFSSENRLPKP